MQMIEEKLPFKTVDLRVLRLGLPPTIYAHPGLLEPILPHVPARKRLQNERGIGMLLLNVPPAQVLHLLDQLDEREATVLRYYLDLSVLEIAQALGVEEGTVKTTLFRARKTLAATLGSYGAGASEEANDVARS